MRFNETKQSSVRGLTTVTKINGKIRPLDETRHSELLKAVRIAQLAKVTSVKQQIALIAVKVNFKIKLDWLRSLVNSAQLATNT